MFQKTFLALALLLPTGSALAYFYSGNDLREPLREYRNAERKAENTDYSKAWEFRGYILGVYDANESQYCMPRDAGSHQLMAVVAKYIEDNPQLWNEPASDLVERAIKSAFPCN